jgi:hypothetical protein
VSSGNRTIRRLSLRGNRRINHAIHMAAITQLRHKHSEGRACYDKKVAGGKTRKEALRSLKRKVSDAIFARLRAGAQKASAEGPGGQPGNGSDSSAAGSHPERQLFGSATPGPDTTIRPGTTAGTPSPSKPTSKKLGQPLDSISKEDSLCAGMSASIRFVGVAENIISVASPWLGERAVKFSRMEL